MNLDFRKLEWVDQIKALDNLYRLENGHNSYLAHLIAKEQYDVFTWFGFSQSNEGTDYWLNLKEEQENDCKV
jgi:hypothetical protein